MKTKALALFILGLLVTFLPPLSAVAQDARDYFTLKAGIYAPTGDLDDLHFGTGFNGEIAYGHYFTQDLAAEIGVGFLESDDISVVPFTLTAKRIYPIENLELFAAGGVGLYFANLDAMVPGTPVGTLTVNDDDVVFGVNLGVGAGYNINSELFVGIEGKYIITSEAEFGGTSPAGAASLETDLDGFVITANFGFRF